MLNGEGEGESRRQESTGVPLGELAGRLEKLHFL